MDDFSQENFKQIHTQNGQSKIVNISFENQDKNSAVPNMPEKL